MWNCKRIIIFETKNKKASDYTAVNENNEINNNWKCYRLNGFMTVDYVY